jgi:mono/diheme cytochrome c family protein
MVRILANPLRARYDAAAPPHGVDAAVRLILPGRMQRKLAAAAAAWICVIGISATSPNQSPQVRPTPDATHSPAQTVKQYCVGCHNDRSKTGDLSLAAFDVARASDHPDISERIIRKLRAGMMPPAGARRPDEAMLLGLRRTLETQMDRWAAANPNPGWRPFQRLTRA